MSVNGISGSSMSMAHMKAQTEQSTTNMAVAQNMQNQQVETQPQAKASFEIEQQLILNSNQDLGSGGTSPNLNQSNQSAINFLA